MIRVAKVYLRLVGYGSKGLPVVRTDDGPAVWNGIYALAPPPDYLTKEELDQVDALVAHGKYEFDVRRADGRRAAAGYLMRLAARLGIEAEANDHFNAGKPTVNLRSPSLSAQVWLCNQDDGFLISWHRAAQPLRPVVAGAWGVGARNDFHKRKATSLCETWLDLVGALESGLLASIDGSAFE